MRKTPPTPRVQKVWRSSGSGFRLWAEEHTTVPEPNVGVRRQAHLGHAGLLQSGDSAAVQSFPPHLGHPTGLTGPHHNDGQLARKHHHRLEDVRPDHRLQAALEGNSGGVSLGGMPLIPVTGLA